ncbi:MAG: tol-pal system protein YbgF [Oceanospirillaceae bacterium]|nr:tol-pal system protein YbgF [Oceanospirillaceae bacterium]
MRIDKYLGFAILWFATALSANSVEIIKVTEGANSVTQRYDLVLIVQQLQAEVRSLRGQVENQQYALDSLKAQQLEMYTDLDGRLGGSSFKKTTATESDSPTKALLSGDEQQDYSTAFAYIKSQELPQAEAAFHEYIKRHPKAKRVSNATYWLGEVNLAQGKLLESSQFFSKLLADFSTSAKVPDAMYKLGRVYQRMGKANEAIAIWQQLVDSHPDAAAATLARNALK